MYRRAARDIAAAAPRGGTVLDAGCGSGHLAVQIARRRPDLHVHGVDLEPGMTATAMRRAERENLADKVQSTVADLADLPLPDGCADLIVSTLSLHHWTDPGAVIASLDRTLRPGGRIWIYDYRFVSSAASVIRPGPPRGPHPCRTDTLPPRSSSAWRSNPDGRPVPARNIRPRS